MPQTAKDRWNTAHYKQMKFSLSPTIAEAFKSVCEKHGLSMASVIAKFMCDYCEIDSLAPKKKNQDKTATRRLRRKEMQEIIATVTALLNAEAGSLDRMPENFRDSNIHAETERIVEALEIAIESLEEVYNP